MEESAKTKILNTIAADQSDMESDLAAPLCVEYESLRELLANELVTEEDRATSELIKSLRHVQKDKVLSKEELLMICK